MLFVGTETFRLDLVEQHFEELGFLVVQRALRAHAADVDVAALAEQDERIAAHLDGVRLAGAVALPLVRDALASGERGAAAAAGASLLALGGEEADGVLLRALRSAPDDALDGLSLGLRQASAPRLAGPLRDLAEDADASVPARITAAAALAFHRLPGPRELSALVDRCPPSLRPVLYRTLAGLGGPWDSRILERALEEDDAVARRAALETSAHLALAGLESMCRALAARGGTDAAEATAFLGVVGGPEDLAALTAAVERPSIAAAALAGLGSLGDPAAVPVLIRAMGDPELTRAAGEAFVRITGARRIEADEPLSAPPGLSDDERMFLDPVIPFDPARAEAYWRREGSRFALGQRWQAGRPVPPRFDRVALDLLTLQARRDVYLGWRARDPRHTPDLELDACPW